MNLESWVGYTAALLTTIAFMPQAWMVLKTRDTRSLSLPMYIIFTLGVLAWLVYGILQGDGALIAANGITGALSATILLAKLRYDVFARKPVAPARANCE
jgi:MtN3 and saliva related transmembrane protein